MQHMETRYTHSPLDIRHYSTEELRREFLVEKIFTPGQIMLTYTHNDRMIFGGVTPTEEALEVQLSSELGVEYFLERRELGVINIGGPGAITIDGQKEPMNKTATISARKPNKSCSTQMIQQIQRNSIYLACQHIRNTQM